MMKRRVELFDLAGYCSICGMSSTKDKAYPFQRSSPEMGFTNLAYDMRGTLKGLQHIGSLLASHRDLIALIQQRVKVLVLVQLRHQLTL